MDKPRASIVGIGATAQGLHPGLTGDDLAVEAARLAMADAGVAKDQVDGLITCKALGGQGVDVTLGQMLGINPDYSATLEYGTCNFSIHLAAMAIASGLARTVLLTYGTDQGSRVSSFAAYPTRDLHHGFVDPIGGLAALMFRRYQSLYGVSDAALGSVVVAQSRWAALNPNAVNRAMMTIEDYLAEPYYIAPIRQSDVTSFHDGGVALVMTSAEQARDLPNRPVDLAGFAQAAPLRSLQNEDNLERRWMGAVGEKAIRMAGVSHDAIDLLMIQEPASIWVLQMLEAMGFARPGEAGDLIASGATSPGGRLPLNTGGGHLRESYMWGWLHIVEIVRQLRGVAGARQISDACVALHASTMVAQKGSASMFLAA